MRINLKPNVEPNKVMSARQVHAPILSSSHQSDGRPSPQRGHHTSLLNNRLGSPAFFVPKSDNIQMRLVTDYCHLNPFVKCPVHPFPYTKEVFQAIPSTAAHFAKLDTVHWCFQLALEQNSSFITTFLLPQGKFRNLKAQMGLNASSDKWCCQSHVIVQGITWYRKLVDNTLIWASSLRELHSRVEIVLETCQRANITISKKKPEIGTEIEFAGHIISPGGIKPDPTKYAAIRNFPAPTFIRDLREFSGLENQPGSFIPDLAHLTSGIRPLLRKGVAWTWSDKHQKTFDMIKEILTSENMVKPFNPDKSTVLLTDASILHGIGFALVQEHKQGLALIRCGSSSVTPTQQQYATII